MLQRSIAGVCVREQPALHGEGKGEERGDQPPNGKAQPVPFQKRPVCSRGWRGGQRYIQVTAPGASPHSLLPPVPFIGVGNL